MSEDPSRASGAPDSSVADLAEAFRGVWRAVVRRRRDFMAVFLTVSITVLIASFLWPATYVARAAILVQKQRQGGKMDAEAERAPTVVSGGVSEQEVNSEIAVLTSSKVLAKTLEDTGLDKAEPSFFTRVLFFPLRLYEDAHAWYHGVAAPTQADRAARGLLSALSVEPMKNSNVLVVSFECGNPHVCEIVLKQLLQNYLTHHVEVHGGGNAETFFEGQANDLQTTLTKKEDELQDLKKSEGVTDMEAERAVQQTIVASLKEERDRMARSVAELDQRIASYQDFLRSGKTQVQTTTVEGRNDYALQSLIQEKLRLELEEVRLQERYKSDSPLLLENKRKLEAATAAIESQVSGLSQKQSSLSPAAISASQDMERTRAERAGYQERILKLDQQIETAQVRLTSLDEKALEARRIERVITTNETQYLQYLRRGVEARIDAALDRNQFTNARLVQEATAEARPIRPKKLWSLIFAIGGGLVAAFAVVIGTELRENGLEAFLHSVAPRAAGELPPRATEMP